MPRGRKPTADIGLAKTKISAEQFLADFIVWFKKSDDMLLADVVCEAMNFFALWAAETMGARVDDVDREAEQLLIAALASRIIVGHSAERATDAAYEAGAKLVTCIPDVAELKRRAAATKAAMI